MVAEASFWRTSFSALRIGWALFFLPFLMVTNPGLLLIGGVFQMSDGLSVPLASWGCLSSLVGFHWNAELITP